MMTMWSTWLVGVLFHATWIATVVALLSVGVTYVAQARPTVRHAGALSALAALMVATIAIGIQTWPDVRSVPDAEWAQVMASPVAPPQATTVSGISAAPMAVSRQDASWHAWVVGLWVVGVTCLLCWHAVGWRRARAWRRAALPAPRVWSHRLQELAQRMAVTAPGLALSTQLAGPAVVGWLRPLILMPPAMLTGLPAPAVEALLLHELAHVRRGDALIEIGVSAIEALLFFHPAVWWLGRELRSAREECCDALALKAGADGRVLAASLLSVAEGRQPPAPMLAARHGRIVERVARLLGVTRRRETDWRGLGAIAILPLLLLVVVACAAQVRRSAPETLGAAPVSASILDPAVEAEWQALVQALPLERRIAARRAAQVSVRIWLVSGSREHLELHLPQRGVLRHAEPTLARLEAMGAAQSLQILTRSLQVGSTQMVTQYAFIGDYEMLPHGAGTWSLPSRDGEDLAAEGNGSMPSPLIAVLNQGFSAAYVAESLDTGGIRLLGVDVRHRRLLGTETYRLAARRDGEPIWLPLETPIMEVSERRIQEPVDLAAGEFLVLPLVKRVERPRAAIADRVDLHADPATPLVAEPEHGHIHLMIVAAEPNPRIEGAPDVGVQAHADGAL